MKKMWLIFLFLPLVLHASRMLEGILLTASSSDIPQKVEGVVFHRLPAIPLLQEELEKEVLHQPLTIDLVKQVREKVLFHCEKAYGSLPFVSIPSQSVASGTVAFIVTKAKVDEVKVSETKWFAQKQFPLEKGEEIDKKKLLDEIAWRNRNPFRFTRAIFSPGDQMGTTKIELLTKERFPLRPYAGANSTGTKFTQEARLYAGCTWGNAFGSEDLFTFQYTASPDFHRLQSLSVNYTSFFPWKHSLIAFGGYSILHPNLPDFASVGKNGQVSLRYKIPFSSREFSFGCDYKFLNTNLFFTETETTPAFTQMTNLSQLMVGYSRGRLKFELFGSFAKWLPHQNNHSYRTLRARTKPRYAYGRLSLSHLHTFPYRFQGNLLLRAQAALRTLLPSEQFPLGGFDTVRGYREWAFSADNAICTNLELHFPSFSLFRKDSMIFLAFADFGYGYNLEKVKPLPSSQFLLSIGPAFRYQLFSYCTARADYGFQLLSIAGEDSLGRFHFGAELSY